jgi:hypothetical protein
VAAQRLGASTLASYRKNIRLHIDPYLGEITLSRLTGAAVDVWMRKLEVSGRVDGRGGLSARELHGVEGQRYEGPSCRSRRAIHLSG